MVIVSKKDGGLRFCVDNRKLTRVMVAGGWPMLFVEKGLEDLNGSENVDKHKNTLR